MKNNINWRIDENFIYLDREFQQVTWMIGITRDRDIIRRFVLKNVDIDINSNTWRNLKTCSMKNNINWRIDENFIYLDREFQQVTWMIGITRDRDIIRRFVLKNVDIDINSNTWRNLKTCSMKNNINWWKFCISWQSRHCLIFKQWWLFEFIYSSLCKESRLRCWKAEIIKIFFLYFGASSLVIIK